MDLDVSVRESATGPRAMLKACHLNRRHSAPCSLVFCSLTPTPCCMSVLQAFVAAPAASRSDKRRFMAIASAVTIALAITALVFVATGSVSAFPMPLFLLVACKAWMSCKIPQPGFIWGKLQAGWKTGIMFAVGSKRGVALVMRDQGLVDLHGRHVISGPTDAMVQRDETD